MFSGSEIEVNHQAVEYEVIRLWGLNERWLGEELLKLSRTIRSEFPQQLGYPGEPSIASGFVWHVLPELARRLGATRLQPNESSNIELRSSKTELRNVVGSCLLKSGLHTWKPQRSGKAPMAWDILSRSISQGNPAAFAIDKLIPPPASWRDEEDYIAHEIRRISRERGVRVSALWNPDLLFMDKDFS